MQLLMAYRVCQMLLTYKVSVRKISVAQHLARGKFVNCDVVGSTRRSRTRAS